MYVVTNFETFRINFKSTSVSIDLSNVISWYTSLNDYFQELRNSFYTFLEEMKLEMDMKRFFRNLREKN